MREWIDELLGFLKFCSIPVFVGLLFILVAKLLGIK
jgi:hypothetical protein